MCVARYVLAADMLAVIATNNYIANKGIINI